MELAQKHLGWTTENEIAYINSLHRGTYPREFRPLVDAKTLLTNYLKWARKRIVWNTWGSVDGHAVVAHAEELLTEMS